MHTLMETRLVVGKTCYLETPHVGLYWLKIIQTKQNYNKRHFSPNNWVIHTLKGHAKLINQSTRHSHTYGIFIVTKNKTDVDMMDFIFMERPIPDVFRGKLYLCWIDT